MEIDVLLATFGGGLFLDDQIRSIYAQNGKVNFRILVRDDGSTDNTRKILGYWADSEPNFVIVTGDEEPFGPSQSYSRLMDLAEAPYVAFSDQDDVWLPEKLHVLHKKILELEQAFGRDMPLLVHSDLTVVDQNMQIIAPSFWKFQRIAQSCTGFSSLLVQNIVTGCTMMANRALIELAKPVPKEAIMHDWWLALVASAFGKIVPVKKPLVKYRQHGANSVGARNWSFPAICRRANQSVGRRSVGEALKITTAQCEIFLHRYDGLLTKSQRDIAEVFSIISSKSFVERRRILLTCRLLPSTIIRKLLWLTWI